MASELETTQNKIEVPAINFAEIIGEILPRGHVFHGYSSTRNERVIKILDSRRYSDAAPMLGFGVDGTAERALGRSLLTYAMREQQGLEAMTATQFPEIDKGQLPAEGHPSKFDNIVWGGDFYLYQDGDEVIAGSTYGGGYGMSPLEIKAGDPLTAIQMLADAYKFVSDPGYRLSSLPAISLE